MIKIGDIVFVQTKGVCELVDISNDAFSGADKTKEYYAFKPIGVTNNMMVYFPIDTKVNIRSLTSKSKATDIFKNFSNLDEIEIKSDESRFEVYNKISKKGNLEEWSRLLKTLLKRKIKENKKPFNMQEQKLINTLTNYVSSELSQVLAIPKSEVEEKLLNYF